MKNSFNKKQKALLEILFKSQRSHGWSQIYNVFRKQLSTSNDINSMVEGCFRSEALQTDLRVISVNNIEGTITPKQSRELLNFVPSRITSFSTLKDNISKYATKSTLIHFNFEEELQEGKEPTHMVVIKKGKHFTPVVESTGGVIWVTFYDNDTKMLIYEYGLTRKYNQERLDPNIERNQQHILAYSTSVHQTSLIKNFNTNNPNPRYNNRSIKATSMNKMPEEDINFYLDMFSIEDKHYEVVSNMQSNNIGLFDTEVL